MTRRILAGALTLIAGAVLSSPLHAAAIDGPHVTSTPIPATLTDWVDTLDFPKFDSALGTLKSVRIELFAELETTITVENTSLSASNGNAFTLMDVTVSHPDFSLNNPAASLITAPFAYSLAGGQTTSSGVIQANGGTDNTYTDNDVLAGFNGPGTITLDASTFTQTLLANTGGNTGADQVTYASLTGQVTYEYCPIPEPSTWVLLALGSVGMMALARRRRK